MSNPVFALGAKISYQEWDTSASTPALKGAAVEFARRKDPGTLQITLGVTDTPQATNEWKILEKFWSDGAMIQISVDLSGTWDDKTTTPAVLPQLFLFNGFISGISTPAVESGSDEALTYTVDFQLTAV